MNKHICRLFAFLLLSPIASAMDVELGGQHRARGIYYQQDVNDIFIQRFKLSGAFRPNEMFESHFWLMTNYQWGNKTNVYNDIRIYGYGDWKMSDELMLRVGRAPYEIGDGSSVGINDYEEYPYVLDGAILTYNTESLAVDIWGAYLPKMWIDNGEEQQRRYNGTVGFSLNLRALPEEFKMANLFGLYAMGQSHSAEGQTATEVNDHIRLGLGIGGDVSGLDYKVTGAIHGADFGSLIEQYFVDAEVGYTLDVDARIYVGGHYESNEYDPFYYSRHGRSGLLDVVQWGKGAIYGKGGISYMPTEDFEVGVAGIYFHKAGNFGKWGNGGKNVVDSSVDLSTDGVVEADLYVKKSWAGGFSVALHGGLYDLVNDNRYWQVQLNTQFDF